MLLLPFERLIMHSPLASELVLRRLETQVEPRRLFRWYPRGHKPYEGKVNGESFSVTRIIPRRNFLLPQVRGKVYGEPDGCSVKITVHANPLAYAFAIVIFAAVGLTIARPVAYFLPPATQSAGQDPFSLARLLIAAGTAILGYTLLLLRFKIDSAKSKAFFRHLFQADWVNELGLRDLFGAA